MPAQNITEEEARGACDGLGFDKIALIDAARLPHGDAFRSWLDQGFAGDMAYLERVRARDQPEVVLGGVRSIIVVAVSYRSALARLKGGVIASYARGYDYHKVLESQLKILGERLAQERDDGSMASRVSVDRLPILDRDMGFVGRLGWYGKNTMLIDRALGSFFFLGALLTTLEAPARDLQADTAPRWGYCGTCTACLDACPTQAFVEAGVLDARRCISYLTIEARGPIPRERRAQIGRHLFGCDVCQDVCPWNRKAPETLHFAFRGRPEIEALTAVDILSMDEPTFRRVCALSPVQRAGFHGLRRNAAVVLGNGADRAFVPLLSGLLGKEEDSVVRAHVAWALGKLGGREAEAALRGQRTREDDPDVLDEIDAAIVGLE